MLRNHAGAYPGHRADGGGPRAAHGSGAPSHRAYYSGIDLVEAEDSNPPADRRRAHQRDRLAPVQEYDRRRKMGRSQRNRALAGEERRAHHRRVPAILGSRRTEGHRSVLREADAEDQSAGDDRHHRSRRPSSARSHGARARASSTRSISKTARKNSSGSARWQAHTARRWSWAPSTKTNSRRRPSPASGNSRSPSARSSCLTEKVRHRARGHHHRSAGVPLRHGR